MAKTKHLKEPSNFELPTQKAESLGAPIEMLKSKDYTALSTALHEKGELRLLDGDKGGVAYFDMAAKLDPSNDSLFFKQGLSLFEFGSHEGNEEGLTLASKRFKRSTVLNPEGFEAWHLWGNTLFFLGCRKDEPSYFTHALKKYEKAISLSEGQPPDVLADLYWDFGDVWGKLAEKSGEITDLHYAIKAYERSCVYQEDHPSEFWINFGNVTMQMGAKTNDTRFYVKAINAYKNAVSITISFPEGWFKLAKALKALYSNTHDDDHFTQASECFSTATQLAGKNSKIWHEWALLYLESGIIFKDAKKLRSAIEKCSKAHKYRPKNVEVIASWATSLAKLGTLTENLEYIHEALNKIDPYLENNKNLEIFYAHGMCNSALGSYYKDIDYHYQAIEAFQEGVSLDRSHGPLWLAMAQSSYDSSLLDHDEKSYDRSLKFFEKAIALKKTSVIHSEFAKCLLSYGEMIHDQSLIQEAVFHFEQAINLQSNAAYIHPDWMYSYAVSLDLLAGFIESDSHYIKAIDILNHILMLKPEFPQIHYRLALSLSHYAELVNEKDLFLRAIHHYRIAKGQEGDNDKIILDWALTLVNLGDLLENDVESDQYLREAEYKMIQAAKLGNTHAYYALACLYSILGDLGNSLRFLEKAKEFDALPTIDDLLEDDWLENLKETESFKEFIAELQHHSHE